MADYRDGKRCLPSGVSILLKIQTMKNIKTNGASNRLAKFTTTPTTNGTAKSPLLDGGFSERWLKSQEPVELANAIVSKLDKSGRIPVTVTIALFPAELVALARKASHLKCEVGDLVAQYVGDGPSDGGGGIGETLRDYENDLPKSKAAV